MRRRKNWLKVVFILSLVAMAMLINWPGGFKLEYKPWKIKASLPDLNVKQGLDLQGGTRIVYQADLSKTKENQKKDAMDSLRKVIENRINAFGVSEPIIQTTQLGNENRLVVELPGVKDVQEAMDLIGKTANLEFKELGEDGQFKSTDLAGKDLKKASQDYDQNGQPDVAFEFNDEGAKKFEKLTERNIGKQIAIYLDDQLISAPRVNQKIGANGIITGDFTLKEAKNLAIQLNAGALPVSIKVIEQRTIGATLGQEAVKKSLFAGVLGVILVMVFMILYYRLPGFIADIALVFYSLFLLALFKLFSVTVTLSGVAAFILSIGMAVDANVLIFERMKEELASGKNLGNAIEAGFKRAWTSIRDSNISSILTASILFMFGSGIIRGFAVVLILGVLVSMFTAINVTRTFLRVLVNKKIFSNHKMYLGYPKENEDKK